MSYFQTQIFNGLQGIKILNDSTPLLITPNGKENKTNINDVKPCSTTDLIENALKFISELNKNKTSKLQLIA